MSGVWAGYDAAETSVDCSGETHRLRWEGGELRAVDHADAEGERTLAALGGQRNDCVEVLDAWHRHRDDLRVLTLASRGPADVLAPQPDPYAQFRSRRGRFASAGAGPVFAPTGFGGGQQRSREDELIALLGLRGSLPDRLAVTVAASWVERLVARDASVAAVRSQLRAALWGRVTVALRTWLCDAALEPDVELIDEDDEPALLREDGTIRARLPFSWLVTVWGRSLATIAGRFCLSATAEEHRLSLVTIAPDFGEPRRLTIEL